MPSRAKSSKTKTKPNSTKRTSRSRAVVGGSSNQANLFSRAYLIGAAAVFVLLFGLIGAIKINGSNAATVLSQRDCSMLGRTYSIKDSVCQKLCLPGAGKYLTGNFPNGYCSAAVSASVTQLRCDTLSRVFIPSQGCARNWQRTRGPAMQCKLSTSVYQTTSTYDYCSSASLSVTPAGWTWPVPSAFEIHGGWGVQATKGIHKGIDIGIQKGVSYNANVVAAHAGTVTKSFTDINCGQMIVISAANTPYYQAYQHVVPASMVVSVGNSVVAGQPLGKIGKYGATTCGDPDMFYHLHFSVEKGNWISYYSSPLRNSVDPCTVLTCPPQS